MFSFPTVNTRSNSKAQGAVANGPTAHKDVGRSASKFDRHKRSGSEVGGKEEVGLHFDCGVGG